MKTDCVRMTIVLDNNVRTHVTTSPSFPLVFDPCAHSSDSCNQCAAGRHKAVLQLCLRGTHHPVTRLDSWAWQECVPHIIV